LSDSNEKPAHSQIMAIFESQKILLQGSNEAINLLLGDLDLSALEADDRVAIQGWHKGIQQALNSLEFPQ
jgi:hypothetical protein